MAFVAALPVRVRCRRRLRRAERFDERCDPTGGEGHGGAGRTFESRAPRALGSQRIERARLQRSGTDLAGAARR
jgi:hypothetical protein